MFLSLTVIVVLAVVLLGIAALILKLREPSSASSSYYLRKSLFSPAERSFLGVLEPNVPHGTRVLGKVRLADIFGVKSGVERSARTAALNRISRKHVDFLLVRTSDLAPLAGIELDDASHGAEDRQQRDALVDSIFQGVGLPLLHFPAQKAYNPAEIRTQIEKVLTS